jgi:hypothetical protein
MLRPTASALGQDFSIPCLKKKQCVRKNVKSARLVLIGCLGYLRHLPYQPKHQPPQLHQPQPSHRPDHLLHYRIPPLRRRPQRRSQRVPDQSSSLSSDPLPHGHLRAGHLGREGLPREDGGGRDHKGLLRAQQSDGEV